MRLNEVIGRIKPLDTAAMDGVRARQAQLTKPAGSLGRLEQLSVQLAGCTGDVRNELTHKAVIVMAGDHGVAAEGVSAFPQAVTPQMVSNFLHGGAAINVLARAAGARVVVVDMGVAADLPPNPALITHKIGHGTGNIAQGPAMTREQAIACLEAGIQVVRDEVARGLDVLALGDMGIANTTPSAAVASTILSTDPDLIVGRGTGIDDAGLAHKKAVVRRALTVNQPDATDGIDILAKVGGFEIGGLAGVILGAAAHRIPIVLDGFITTAAALIAVQIAPIVRDYLIPSHCSQESGHAAMLHHLGLTALFDYQLRLGEGSGAAIALHTVDVAARIVNEMATFAEAGVSGKQENE